MFLEDDDLLVKDYCHRVINRIQSLPDDCTFGYSASYHLELDGSWTEVPSKLPAGVLGNETPLKNRQAGPGKSCWITRTAFDPFGGRDEGIDVNKDTEFSVRLAASGHRFYCDQTPGVFLILDPVRSASDQSSITKAAGARARFLGFEYVLLRHQDFLKGHRTFRQKCSRALSNTACVPVVWPVGFGFALSISRLVMCLYTSSLELFDLASQSSYRANLSNGRIKASMLFHVNSHTRLVRPWRD